MPLPKSFLLGAPRIEVDGVPAELDTRKALALIACMAVTRQRHSRDSLSTLLWPAYGDSRARASLRRTLSSLNRALAGDWLDVERASIGLNPPQAIRTEALVTQPGSDVIPTSDPHIHQDDARLIGRAAEWDIFLRG